MPKKSIKSSLFLASLLAHLLNYIDSEKKNRFTVRSNNGRGKSDRLRNRIDSRAEMNSEISYSKIRAEVRGVNGNN